LYIKHVHVDFIPFTEITFIELLVQRHDRMAYGPAF
jgi:hypothetical protein